MTKFSATESDACGSKMTIYVAKDIYSVYRHFVQGWQCVEWIAHDEEYSKDEKESLLEDCRRDENGFMDKLPNKVIKDTFLYFHTPGEGHQCGDPAKEWLGIRIEEYEDPVEIILKENGQVEQQTSQN